MLKLLFAGAVLALASVGAANAGTATKHPTPETLHTWYILNMGTGECRTMKSVVNNDINSPLVMHTKLRNSGFVDSVDTRKGDDGTVEYVIITCQAPDGQKVEDYLFPSKDLCNVGQTAAQISGEVPDEDDLK